MRGDGQWESYESIVDRRIREAQDEGKFDGLRGAGRPLRGLHRADDENWWLRSYLERENVPTDVLLPTPLRLRREVERLPGTVAGMETELEVRAAVAEVAARVAQWMRFPDGPRVAVPMPRADAIVEGWRAGRAAGVEAPPAAPACGAPRAPSRWRRWWRALRRRA
ncbi:DnaJ family domain-containing protein [Actinomycetospora sp. C-140]